jgi:hypothetical protein
MEAPRPPAKAVAPEIFRNPLLLTSISFLLPSFFVKVDSLDWQSGWIRLPLQIPLDRIWQSRSSISGHVAHSWSSPSFPLSQPITGRRARPNFFRPGEPNRLTPGPPSVGRPPFFQSICFFGRALGERESDSRFFRKVKAVNVWVFLLGSLCLKKPKLSFIERTKGAIENPFLKHHFEYQLGEQLSSLSSPKKSIIPNRSATPLFDLK